jgi:hypothetical protein
MAYAGFDQHADAFDLLVSGFFRWIEGPDGK